MRSLEEQVIQTVEDYRYEPFDWASFNCALGAATMATEWTGIDYAANWRDDCTGRISATRIWLKSGWSKLMLDAGLHEATVEEASVGDFILTAGRGKQQAIGIVYDDTRSVVPTVFGMGFVTTLSCDKTFKTQKPCHN